MLPNRKALREPAEDVTMKSLLISTLLLTIYAPVASAATDSKAEAASTQPPAQTALLYPRIGTWQVTIRTQPSKDSPQGGTDKGVMTIKKGPGGFSIVQDFWSRGSSGYTVGQSYAWWDSNSKSYKSVWCDNMQGCIEFTTVIDGNAWTVQLNGTANGQPVRTTIHATMSADHNAIHEEVSSSYDGEPAKLESVSEYKRVAAGVKR